jgi:hypothetical protein
LAPLIFSDEGAFQFSVPESDGTPVVGLLPMDRLIALTERAAYVIRGGEQGILTPTTINPLKISSVGSAFVEPKMVNNKGYYLSYDRKKLMLVVFGDDGNLQVTEASVFSDHFFNETVVQMETVDGVEQTLYLLTSKGKLIRVTCNDEGIHGFSEVDIGCYVESIYASENSLILYTIRNSQRYTETLFERNDLDKNEEVFSDFSIGFGHVLYKSVYIDTSGERAYQYVRVIKSTNLTISEDTDLNIETPVSLDWSAGSIIKIRSNFSILPQAVDFEIHFFYENENGEESTLRYVIDQIAGETSTGDPTWQYEYQGFFKSEVPALLRDARNNTSLTLSQKRIAHTRWAPAQSEFFYPDNIPLYSTYGLLSLFEAGKKTSTDTQVAVSVTSRGSVLSSPLNPDKQTLYITKDNSDPMNPEYSITLPDFYTSGYIGFPYESDFETLDLEASDNRTLTDSRKLLNAVGIALHETRGGFFGIENAELDNMSPLSPVNYSPYNEHEETDNFNGHISIPIPTNWSERGRVRVRQVDPLPMTILSIYPKGIAGD